MNSLREELLKLVKDVRICRPSNDWRYIDHPEMTDMIIKLFEKRIDEIKPPISFSFSR